MHGLTWSRPILSVWQLLENTQTENPHINALLETKILPVALESCTAVNTRIEGYILQEALVYAFVTTMVMINYTELMQESIKTF